MESNFRVRFRDCAAQKAPEGMADRHTHTHTIRPLYNDYIYIIHIHVAVHYRYLLVVYNDVLCSFTLSYCV